MTDETFPSLTDYHIEKLFSRDECAITYSATHRLSTTSVFVQVVSENLANRPDFLERLRVNARGSATLTHPHVLRTRDVFTADGHLYVILDAVVGVPLQTLVRDGKALPPATALTVVDNLLSALETIHSAGLHHGDIGVNALIATRDGDTVVSGLILAETVASYPQTERNGYLSPERIAGGAPSARSDIYAVAALTNLLLTGDLPTSAGNAGGDLPGIAAVIKRALLVDPMRRYASATELRQALVIAAQTDIGPSFRLLSDLRERVAAALGQLSSVPIPAAPPPLAAAAVPASAAQFRIPPPPSARVAGTRVSPPDVTPAVPPPPVAPSPIPMIAAGPASPTPIDDDPVPSPPKKKSRKKLWIGLAVAIIVIGAGTGGFFVLRPRALTASNLTLTASPQSASCNSTFVFTAKGTLSGSGQLTYYWQRDDGTKTAPTSVTVTDQPDFAFTYSLVVPGKQKPTIAVTFWLSSPATQSVSQTVGYTC